MAITIIDSFPQMQALCSVPHFDRDLWNAYIDSLSPTLRPRLEARVERTLAAGLSWEEQYLPARRIMVYKAPRHKMEIGATKRKKIRTVDFCDTLAEILKKARKQQHRERFQCGEMYFRNYYQKVMEKGRTHYDLYSLQSTEEIPDDYEELSFVCLRQDGSYESTATLSNVCRLIQKHVEGLENFHFHQLRHTYTSNLLSNGAAPKDVQELLGHSDVSTTMNVYAHATREAKRTSARLLDKVVGGN